MKNQNVGGRFCSIHFAWMICAVVNLCGCSENKQSGSEIPKPAAPPVVMTAPPASNTDSAPSALAVKESPAIQGLWLMKSASLAGKEMPKAVTDTISLEITGTNYLVKVGPGMDKGTSEIDASVTPNRMKIVGTEGPNAGKTLLAIVEFPNQDEMKICYDLTGKDYPTSFDSTAENGYYLVTYRRETKQ